MGQSQRREGFPGICAYILKKIIFWQKTFAGIGAKAGQKLYDVMLDSYEKGFGMKELDEFFGLLKKELVPLLHQVMESPIRISDEFLTGDYPEDRQRELAEYLAEYVGFDFRKAFCQKVPTLYDQPSQS